MGMKMDTWPARDGFCDRQETNQLVTYQDNDVECWLLRHCSTCIFDLRQVRHDRLTGTVSEPKIESGYFGE